MKKAISVLGTTVAILTLAACQNMPQPYNGTSGYEVESKTEQSAILSYTLATHENQQINQQKLQHACQKVLGKNKTYQVNILSKNEIANPAKNPNYGVNIGHSQTTFGLVGKNSQTDNPAARNALETHPNTLQVVRYECS